MKLTVGPLLVLLFIAIKSFSQDTKKVEEESGEKWVKVKKVYAVLKDDPTIKQGAFEQYFMGKRVITGSYKNNKKDGVWQRYSGRGAVLSRKVFTEGKRTGVWEFLSTDETTAWQYDFNTNTYTNKPPTFPIYTSYQALNGTWVEGKPDQEPIWLCSIMEWQYYLNFTLRYPQAAIDKNVQGTATIELTIDEEGNVTDYAISNPGFDAIDQEGLRVVKLFEPEFIPAMKDGKKVKAKVKIQIHFRLER